MDVTTLLVPLYAVSQLTRRLIPVGMAYVNIGYRHVLALSATCQCRLVL
ncbi:hypothetical protein [Delftia acidovorans]|nr:hypothetical protein [Delftia acidovorans]